MVSILILFDDHIVENVVVVVFVHVEIVKKLLEVIERHPKDTVFFGFFDEDVLVAYLLLDFLGPQI